MTRRATSLTERAAQAARVLVGMACFSALGCDNSMSFNPTAPQWPDWNSSLAGVRTLEIDGVLQAQDGSCLEATVLYDGLEVPGARSRCPSPAGCSQLELTTSFQSTSGQHTIAFQVLRQSRELADYRAQGSVRVSREGVNLGGVPMRLGPTVATLAAGETVSFEIQFSD